MGGHHILDPDKASSDTEETTGKGHDLRSLGPSDSSDTGSDLVGSGLVDDDGLGTNGDLASDDTSDRNGTGERLTIGEEPDVRVANDIAPDRIVGADEAGLGGGLDQAEEALLGITDEELAKRSRHN